MYTPLEVIELSKFYNKREVIKNISLSFKEAINMGEKWCAC